MLGKGHILVILLIGIIGFFGFLYPSFATGEIIIVEAESNSAGKYEGNSV